MATWCCLGDALHTAHFSIGSGTKLALEDAIALKQCFDRSADVGTALAEFEQVRKPIIEEYQAAARESCEWFENARRYMHLSPLELAYALMTRSGRVDQEKLRASDPDFIAAYEEEVSRRGAKSKAEALRLETPPADSVLKPNFGARRPRSQPPPTSALPLNGCNRRRSSIKQFRLIKNSIP